MPHVNGYSWTDNDVAYAQFGNYISKPTNNDIVYPFRSLFTKRSTTERGFTVTENDTTISISSTVEATAANMVKSNTVVYDSAQYNDLLADNVTTCGLLKNGKATAENTENFLRFTSTHQRECLSFDIPNLEHKNGYLAAVTSRHIEGRPLSLAFINDTAKHTELEVYLEKSKADVGEWQTDYFILPPLASDGLGYTVYIANDAIGSHPTVNEMRSLQIYTMPYEEMVHLRTFKGDTLKGGYNNSEITVSHPNPALYLAKLDPVSQGKTLVLSQSFDNGWIAYDLMKKQFLTHVLVNNWENGWQLPQTNEPTTIVIFFWPQLLEWIGFILLPIPFLFLLRQHRD
jgi:hypothetical protein